MPIRLGSVSEDFHVTAVDLSAVLKINEGEISRLARNGTLMRIPYPGKRRVFVYPVFENVRRFLEYLLSAKEQVHQQFLQEKARRERALANRAEVENKFRDGSLVDRNEMLGSLIPTITAFRSHVLSRSDRLARELALAATHKSKATIIRRADEKALEVLAGLLDGNNGARKKV
jgi:hypothetical protein